VVQKAIGLDVEADALAFGALAPLREAEPAVVV